VPLAAPYCGISLLHAAIYIDEPALVKRLMELGADPAAPSDVGSARMLATNLLGDRKNDEKSREILHILTGSAPNAESDSSYVSGLSDPLDADMQEDMNDRSEVMEYVAGKDLLNVEATMEQKEQPKRRRRWDDASGEDDETPLDNAASTVTATSLSTIPNATLLANSACWDEMPATSSVVKTLAAGAPPLAQGSDSLTRRDSNHYENTSTASHQPGNAKILLPSLDYWFQKGEKPCIYFNRADGCQYGRACHNLHINPPLGQKLDDKPVQLHHVDFRHDCVTTRQFPNGSGGWFYAAVYRDSRAENIVYEAERGRSVGQNRQGVYWYKSENDAVDALKRVMVARTKKDDFVHSKRSKHSGNVSYPHESQLKMEHYERPDKRAHHKSDAASMPASKSLFFRVLKSNLSSVFQQTTGDFLRKEDWNIERTIHESHNFVKASFIFDKVRHQSTQAQGGTWFDGAWWHTDDRRAKASAFEQFLQSCISKGTVNRDCTMTREGKRISSLVY
jgi:hypothetical protein